MRSTTRLLAVLGHPVRHSLSPAMHAAALAAMGEDAVYVACDVAPDDFAAAVRGLAALGAIGCNVTLPHKEAALALADVATPTARRIGAANTLRFRAGAIEAENTDAAGFVDLVREEGGVDPAGIVAAVVGAGGAGRAMAWGLAEAGAARLLLANRTRSRAEELAALLRAGFAGLEVEVVAAEAEAGWAALREAALVANATSLGLRAGDPSPVPAAAFAPGALAVDSVYAGDGVTPFLREAGAAGARRLGGLGMLVHQGARSLAWWLGRAADRGVMRRAAEAERARRAAEAGASERDAAAE